MNQEQNNLNQNNFNSQDNNSTLNNQSQVPNVPQQNIDQSPLNEQFDVASNNQQPIQTNNANIKLSKKVNLKLIISIVCAVTVFSIVIIVITNNKTSNLNNKNKTKNNLNIETSTSNNSSVDSETTSNIKDNSEFEYTLKNNYNITNDWKECNIIIDGKTYIIGQTQLKEFKNNGWEYNANFIENDVNNGNTSTLKPNGESVVIIKNEKYGSIITAFVKNNTSVEQNIDDCTVSEVIISLSSLNKESYPDIVIANNISFNNKFKDTIDSYGKASEIINKGDGYYMICWNNRNEDSSHTKVLSILIKEKKEDRDSSKIVEIAISCR